MCAEEKWLEFCEYESKKKDTYFLGMGDYDDLASTSERSILHSPILHDSTVKTLEKAYLTHTMRLAKEIKFMKGKLIGMLEGNHYGKLANGTTTTQKLCELMDTTYLGCNSFIQLTFGQEGRHSSRSVKIFAHHGRGGGRTAGASMNPLEKMGEMAEADIYLMGDNHAKSIMNKERLTLRTGGGKLRLSRRKILLARTGCFLKGYEPGESSYIADANYCPTDLGVVKIELVPRRYREDGDERVEIDIHASI
jgi:hypothetical protein